VPSSVACPFCGGRLVSKSGDRPPRLVCADCGGLLPQNNQPSLLGSLDRQAPGLVMLLLMVVLPLVALALSPWVQLPQERRSARLESGRAGLNHQRWDPRSGVVGRPAAAERGLRRSR